MRRAAASALTVVAAAGAVAIGWPSTGSATSVRPVAGSQPADFSHPVANAYFPLEPGLVVRYRGTDGPEKFHESVRVTHKTKMIEGVRTIVVRDVLRRADGTVAESTRDWYADDNSGNVWYFGENTATYDRDGHVRSRGGSWEAGVNGAHKGLIMPADPRPTDAYRQEFRRGHAEDQAWVVQTNARTTVPAGKYRHVVRTYEWSRLEKGVISTKLYARGVGIITERDVSGGTEQFDAVRVRHH